MKRIVSAAWAAVLVATVLGCSRQAVTTLPMVEGKAAREFATELRRAVTVDAMVGHLAELQEIADANGGTRAVGTPGFDASVDYVAGVLRDSGFDVQTPESLVEAIRAFEGLDGGMDFQAMRRNAGRFSKERFQREFRGMVERQGQAFAERWQQLQDGQREPQGGREG